MQAINASPTSGIMEDRKETPRLFVEFTLRYREGH